MSSCAVCLESETSGFTECDQCKICVCYECYLSWANTQITGAFVQKGEQGKIFLENMSIKCSNNTCSYSHSVQELQLSLPPQQFERISLTLNRKYLQLDFCSDLMACPNSECSAFGFTAQKNCVDDYQCAECNYTWRTNEQTQ